MKKKANDVENLINSIILGYIIGKIIGLGLTVKQIKTISKKLKRRKHVRLRLDPRRLSKLKKERLLTDKIPIFHNPRLTQIGAFYVPPAFVSIVEELDPAIGSFFRENREAKKRAKKYGLVVVPRKPHTHILLHEIGHGRSTIGEGSKAFQFVRDYVVPILRFIPFIGRIPATLLNLAEEYSASRFAKRKSKRISERQAESPILDPHLEPEEIEDSWDLLWPAFKTYLYSGTTPYLGAAAGAGLFYLFDSGAIDSLLKKLGL